MPRLPRLHVPGGCYHVILRGNHREDIFSVANDRLVLNDIVAESIAKYAARVHAFCWMTNHLHALVQISETPLGKLMQRIATHYSRYRHRQLRTTGHLFERRYRAWLVEADAYFIALLRYIHLNPVAARMVRTADDYAWSSHRAYAGVEVMPWLSIDFGLSLFGSTVSSARANYRMLMSGELYASEERLLDDTHPDDPRVLGGDRFLSSLPPPRINPKSRLTLDELVKLVSEQMSVSIDDIKSPSKCQKLSRARAEIARRAVQGRIASLNEMARYMDRHPSSICRLLERWTRM